MNFTLTRTDFLSTGIFGQLVSDDNSLSFFSLERPYPVNHDSQVGAVVWEPKVPAGVYPCLRGQHKLEGMTHSFETFEVTNVPGHTNILFHRGNFSSDSSGCILIGLGRDQTMITHSRDAFQLFMSIQDGINEFQLTVI